MKTIFYNVLFSTVGNFPPEIVNASDVINATLDGIVQFNITAEDKDTVKFEVINKPKSATVTQSGNVLYFYWPVLSSQKVHNFKQSVRPSIICFTTVLWVVTQRSSGVDRSVTTQRTAVQQRLGPLLRKLKRA